MFFGVLLLLMGIDLGLGCTVIAVGRKASADGSVILAHTDDAGGGASDLRLVRVPNRHHRKHSQRPVYATDKGYPRLVTNHRGPMYVPQDGQKVFEPLGFIPEVSHTYSYYEANYGLVNEVGLAIAESSVASRTIGWSTLFPFGYNMFDINELTKIALERCATARCAIRTMGGLAEKYGFYSNYSGLPTKPGFVDSAEVLAIADREGEVWIFNLLSGEGNRSAIWAAQRVPDDHVAVVANALTIRTMDLDDEDRFMASKNVKEVAKRNGWWSPSDGPFDFAAAYIFPTSTPLIPLYVGRRMWRIYDLLAPSLYLDPNLGYYAVPGRPTYPFSVKPEQKVQVRDIMRIMRDHYEGTQFDLTQGAAAGPWGNPVRYGIGTRALRSGIQGGWERAISMYRAVYSMVISIRPNMPPPISGVMWFGQDAPHGTVFVPFYGGQETVPPSYLEGKQSEFSTKSAYWAFNFVNVWSYQMYSLIHQEIEAMQKVLEDEAFQLQQEMDEYALRHGLTKEVEHRQVSFAEHVVDEWWAFAWRLVAKYNNGYICTGEKYREQRTWGYPVWWLQWVGYDKWPGDTFIYPPNVTPKFALQLPPAEEDPVQLKEESSSHWLQNLFFMCLGAAGAFAMIQFTGRRYITLP